MRIPIAMKKAKVHRFHITEDSNCSNLCQGELVNENMDGCGTALGADNHADGPSSHEIGLPQGTQPRLSHICPQITTP